MTRWREAVLFMMATGFVWYLFLTPQQGAGSVDDHARQGLKSSEQALQTASLAARQAARGLFIR